MEETWVFCLEFRIGTVCFAQVWSHDLFHDQLVDFIALGVLEGDIVEAETDVSVVETDLFIQGQSKNVEIDQKRH